MLRIVSATYDAINFILANCKTCAVVLFQVVVAVLDVMNFIHVTEATCAVGLFHFDVATNFQT